MLFVSSCTFYLQPIDAPSNIYLLVSFLFLKGGQKEDLKYTVRADLLSLDLRCTFRKEFSILYAESIFTLRIIWRALELDAFPLVPIFAWFYYYIPLFSQFFAP